MSGQNVDMEAVNRAYALLENLHETAADAVEEVTRAIRDAAKAVAAEARAAAVIEWSHELQTTPGAAEKFIEYFGRVRDATEDFPTQIDFFDQEQK